MEDVTYPEKHLVTVSSQHHTFTVDNAVFYGRLKDQVGRKVVLSYRDQYRVVYASKNGKQEAVQRDLVSHELVDVRLK